MIGVSEEEGMFHKEAVPDGTPGEQGMGRVRHGQGVFCLFLFFDFTCIQVHSLLMKQSGAGLGMCRDGKISPLRSQDFSPLLWPRMRHVTCFPLLHPFFP